MFTRDSARRIAAQVRQAERRPRGGIPARPTPPAIAFPLYLVLVTQQVGVRSGTTLGLGKCKLQACAYDASDAATYSDFSTAEFPLYSGATGTSTIAVGRLCIAGLISGRLHVLVDFC